MKRFAPPPVGSGSAPPPTSFEWAPPPVVAPVDETETAPVFDVAALTTAPPGEQVAPGVRDDEGEVCPLSTCRAPQRAPLEGELGGVADDAVDGLEVHGREVLGDESQRARKAEDEDDDARAPPSAARGAHSREWIIPSRTQKEEARRIAWALSFPVLPQPTAANRSRGDCSKGGPARLVE